MPKKSQINEYSDNVKFDQMLVQFDLIPSSADPCVHHSKHSLESNLGTFVDDGIIRSTNENKMQAFLQCVLN